MLQVMVMADTSYHPLGVDEVAAQHADAQCVVSCIMLTCGSSPELVTWGQGETLQGSAVLMHPAHCWQWLLMQAAPRGSCMDPAPTLYIARGTQSLLQQGCHSMPARFLQIHYGRASLSPLSRLSAYFVFGREPLPVAAAAQHLAAYAAELAATQDKPKALVVLLDQPYLHTLPALQLATAQEHQVSKHCSPQSPPGVRCPHNLGTPAPCEEGSCCACLPAHSCDTGPAPDVHS